MQSEIKGLIRVVDAAREKIKNIKMRAATNIIKHVIDASDL
jgi:hypothetical protein